MGGIAFTQASECLKLKLLRAILVEYVEGPGGEVRGSHRVDIQGTPDTSGILFTSSSPKDGNIFSASPWLILDGSGRIRYQYVVQTSLVLFSFGHCFRTA